VSILDWKVAMMQSGKHPIACWLEAAVPGETAARASIIRGYLPFDGVEALAVSNAVTARRSEFHTGRHLARLALRALGGPLASIPVGGHRAPVWPDAFVGSISHSRGLCAAQVGPRNAFLSVGIDLTPDIALDAGLAAQIVRPDELADGASPALRLAAKEAFYKCCFPLTHTFLDFHDVRVVFDDRLEFFQARISADAPPAAVGVPRLDGRAITLEGHSVAACWKRA
jgi:4'-phosphopantetheinyl transferase EntD